jgi:hypothetical protein
MADFSLGDLNLDSVPEIVVLPAGTQLQVVLKSLTLKKGKSGVPYLNAIIEYDELVDGKEVETIFHTVFLPNENGTVKQQNNAKRGLNDFANGFKIAPNDLTNYVKENLEAEEIEPMESAKGSSAYVVLGDDTFEGKLRNTIVSFV